MAEHPPQPGPKKDDRELDFRESEIEGGGIPEPRPPRAWAGEGDNLTPLPVLPAEGDPGLEIEWMDENRPPPRGKLFAEPAPEPPPQPFEQFGRKKVSHAGVATPVASAAITFPYTANHSKRPP